MPVSTLIHNSTLDKQFSAWFKVTRQTNEEITQNTSSCYGTAVHTSSLHVSSCPHLKRLYWCPYSERHCGPCPGHKGWECHSPLCKLTPSASLTLLENPLGSPPLPGQGDGTLSRWALKQVLNALSQGLFVEITFSFLASQGHAAESATSRFPSLKRPPQETKNSVRLVMVKLEMTDIVGRTELKVG